ncbi:peptide chain release factor H, partial [Pseudomonas aeruginosa]|nr:peptide chain release factor H [Pseudomonas aeruginosa]
TPLACVSRFLARPKRSHHPNRGRGNLLIARRLEERANSASDALRAERHQAHARVSRGEARRVFRGERFGPA